MDSFSTYDFIEDWWANNGGRAKNMSVQIQKITEEYIEIGLDGNILQLTIPKNFTADGIIRSTDCAFVVTLTQGKDESSSTNSVQELIIALNEKLDRLSSHGNYSFGSVLDSVLDTLEKCKNCSDSEAMAVEIYNDEDAGSISDGEGYSTATSPVSAPEEFLLKRLYFHQLADDANRTCDLARTMAMSARVEVKGLKDDILRCCRLHLPSHRVWCVRIEMELTGILSDQDRHRHVHVFEALGFSFATPLLIELKFDSWNMEKDSRSGESLGNALQGVSAWHEGVDSKVSHNARNFACNKALPAELHERIIQAIDDSEVDPVHLYGLRFLLPRMTRDFFSAGGRDPDNIDNDEFLACEDNIFVRLLLFIGSRLNSLLKQCIVCNKELPFAVSKLCSCSDELCLFGFEVLGWGAQVLPEVKSKPVELLDLEISFAFAAAKNELRDVFEPFPPFLLKDREIRQRSGFFNNNKNSSGSGQSGGSNLQQNKNMEVLRSIINSFPPVTEMRLCANDVELKAKLAISWLSGAMNSVKVWADKYFGKEAWQLPYNVLRFILCTNRLSLVFISEDEDKLLKDGDTAPFWKCYQFAVVQDSPEREAHLESLRTTKLPAGTHGSCSWYPNIRKKKKPWYSNILKKLKSSRSKPHKSLRSKPQCSKFLFHGSNADNWYSILRNGLRCLSSTALMSRGNTSGDGIYMAKYFNISACYCLAASSLSGWKNGMYKDGFYVVSICEIISCPIKKCKKAKERVVRKEYEGNVAVRYLLVNTCSKTHRDCVALTKCRCCFGAHITNGNTWHDRANNNKINLHEHYQHLRQKYLSSSSSSREYERPALIAQPYH